jgi:hypothetical protein
MSEIKLPVDFERLPEFRLLAEAISTHMAEVMAEHAHHARPYADAMTSFVFTRLWVELAYAARSGAKLGELSTTTLELYERSFPSGLFERGVLTRMLIEQKVVTSLTSGGVYCERFARTNPHLAADAVSPQQRGAARSALSRARPALAAAANQQLMMLPSTLLKDRNGKELDGVQQQRVLVLIKTLDNVLQPQLRRNHGDITEGMVADAAEVIGRWSEEQLMQFYYWLLDNRSKPGVPTTAEQVLANFEAVSRLMAG